jgi:hypothetical protein
MGNVSGDHAELNPKPCTFRSPDVLGKAQPQQLLPLRLGFNKHLL